MIYNISTPHGIIKVTTIDKVENSESTIWQKPESMPVGYFKTVKSTLSNFAFPTVDCTINFTPDKLPYYTKQGNSIKYMLSRLSSKRNLITD